VSDPAGKPLEGVLVMAMPSGNSAYRSDGTLRPEKVRSTPTTRDGRARLEGLPPGPWTVAVHARGLVTRVLQRVSAGPLAVRLERGGAVTGVVRDGETGRPLRDARVSVRAAIDVPVAGGWEDETLRNEATTDAMGRFRLEGIGRTAVRLSARAPGFGVADRADVRAGQAVELFLFAGAMLEGMVRDEAGRPVKAALVSAEADEPGNNAPTERTDAQGAFQIAGIRPGEYTVVARQGWYAPGIAAVVVEPGRTASVALTLSDGGYLTGRILSAQGRPAAGRAQLEAYEGRSLPGSLRDRMTAEAKADGAFALGPLPLGRVGIGVSAPFHVPLRVDAVVPARGRTVDLGDLSLEAGLSIRGRVRDRAHNPVPGATVQAAPHDGEPLEPSLETDADGAFRLGGLAPGRYDLTAEAAGFASASATVDAGGEPVELVLEPGGVIAGRVVDENGAPINDARVNAERSSDSPGSQRFAGARADEGDGGFSLRDLAAGTWALAVRATGHGEASLSAVKVAAGRTVNVGTIVLGHGGVVRGSVVTTDGSGVPGATVGVEREANRRRRLGETLTDSSGAFEIQGVPSGLMRVIARHPSFAEGAPVVTDVDPEKEPTSVRIVLVRGGNLEGRVLHRDGRPFTGGRVSARAADIRATAQWAMAPIAGDGSFSMEHLSPGRTTVTAMAFTPSSPLLLGGGENVLTGVASREVDVRDGETSPVELALRDVVVAGKVTRAGQPASGVAVTVLSHRTAEVMTWSGPQGGTLPEPGPPPMSATTREDGSYELLVFTPGPSAVSLQASGQSYPDRDADIPDAERYELDLEIAGATVSGVVVDRDGGAPVSGASVSARRVGGEKDWSGSADCAADGRFSLAVEPGEYRLEARAPDRQPASVPLSVGAAGVADVRVEMERGLEITGRLLDAAGRPAPGTVVTATGPEAEYGGRTNTLADASFRLGGLAARPYTVVAGSEILGFDVRPGVVPGGDAVTLRLRPAGRVVVRVTDGAGQPVGGAYVRIETVDGAAVRLPTRGCGPTDANGACELASPGGIAGLAAFRDTQSGRASVAVRPGETAALTLLLSDTTKQR
jgi:protocatechuate 3,4-dioxygenase beta subunit